MKEGFFSLGREQHMREDGNGPHLESLKKTKNVGWSRVERRWFLRVGM